MTDYVFYKRDDEGTHEVASLVAGKISGPDAEKIHELLRSLGWKAGGDPTLLLHGSRLWAAEKPAESSEKDRA